MRLDPLMNKSLNSCMFTSLSVKKYLILAVLAFTSGSLFAASEKTKEPKALLEPFNYHGVSIDAGLIKKQLDEVHDFYLQIPNDDLLKGFRARAGLPAPG